MLSLEIFANDRYTILKLLKENQIKIKEDSYASLSQQEIADLAHFSKVKTNRIINELIDLECVIPFQNKRGKYSITEKGLKLVKLFETTIL